MAVTRLHFRVFQTLSILIATVCFGLGGGCWREGGVDRCEPKSKYDHGIMEWGSRRMGGMFIILITSIMLAVATVVSLCYLINGKPHKLRPECCGAFWCIYHGAFVSWFSVAYSPLPGAFSLLWALAAAFYIVAAFLYFGDMIFEIRMANLGRRY